MSKISRVCIISNGCPENRHDSANLERFFRLNGYSLSADYRRADLILFNACALTNVSERLSMRVIKQIQKKTGCPLIVFGCLPRINPGLLKTIYRGITFGSDETGYLEQTFSKKELAGSFQSGQIVPFLNLPIYHKFVVHRESIFSLLTVKEMLLAYPDTFDTDTFYLKIAAGCNYSCSYCAAKISRGNMQSKPADEIIAGFKQGLAAGFSNFALIGTEIGNYGLDIHLDLIDLLKKIAGIPGDYQIKLRNLHPKSLIDMFPRLRTIFKTGKISFLSSSFQSGSDKILKLMRRGYRIDAFKDVVSKINNEFPEIITCTQVMAGFPGETTGDFHLTLGVLDQLEFDYIEPFMFQCRPGTTAEQLPEPIPSRVLKKRFRKLIFKTIALERQKRKKRKKRIYHE